MDTYESIDDIALLDGVITQITGGFADGAHRGEGCA